MNIQQRINEQLKRDNTHQNVDTWRASELGKCLRGNYFRRLGETPTKAIDDRTLRVFECGKIFEKWVIDMITKNVEDWDEQVEVSLTEYDAVGHYDIRIGEVINELKTVHSKKFWYMQKDGKPDEHYMMQLMFYLMATGKKEGHLVYVSKDDLSIAEYILYADNEAIKNKVIEELEILNECWKTKTLPPAQPLEINGKSNWKATYCNYHEKCLGLVPTEKV